MSALTDKEIQGLLRAHKTGAVVINEGLELLEKYTVKNSKEEPIEDAKQEIISEEETQHGQETNEERVQEITQEVLINDSSKELDDDKQAPVKQTRNTRKKS